MFTILFFFIISFIVFFKTVSYGLYEIKYQKNKIAGITVIILAIITLLATNLLIIFH